VVQGLIDFTRPVALLMIAVLHFIPGAVEETICGYRSRLATGSILAITHAAQPASTPAAGTAETVAGIYQNSPTPLNLRTAAQISALFQGFEVLSPGVVPVERWRPEPHQIPIVLENPETYLAGVGQIPLPLPRVKLTSKGGWESNSPPQLVRAQRGSLANQGISMISCDSGEARNDLVRCQTVRAGLGVWAVRMPIWCGVMRYQRWGGVRDLVPRRPPPHRLG
jgi:hypothetical protein